MDMRCKFFYLIAFLMFASSAVFAQNEGRGYLKGIFGANVNSIDVYDSKSDFVNFSADLEVGYFMTDNLSFGFRANADVVRLEGDDFDENVRVYAFGPALTVHNRINSHFEYSPNLFVGYGLAKCDGADMANGLVANLSLLSFDVYATESLCFGVGFLDMCYGSVRFKDDMGRLKVKAKRLVFGVNPEVRLSVFF